MNNWKDLPANAQTIRTVECCIDRLNNNNPYPQYFGVAKLGYETAIYQLEKYMCELTEYVEDTIQLTVESPGCAPASIEEIVKGLTALNEKFQNTRGLAHYEFLGGLVDIGIILEHARAIHDDAGQWDEIKAMKLYRLKTIKEKK